MCLIGVKETYVQKRKKVTKNILGQICTTVSSLKPVVPFFLLPPHWKLVFQDKQTFLDRSDTVIVSSLVSVP